MAINDQKFIGEILTKLQNVTSQSTESQIKTVIYLEEISKKIEKVLDSFKATENNVIERTDKIKDERRIFQEELKNLVKQINDYIEDSNEQYNKNIKDLGNIITNILKDYNETLSKEIKESLEEFYEKMTEEHLSVVSSLESHTVIIREDLEKASVSRDQRIEIDRQMLELEKCKIESAERMEKIKNEHEERITEINNNAKAREKWIAIIATSATAIVGALAFILKEKIF
jgi:hypothetical protein